ncbi:MULTISPECIES: signal peptidase I [Halobacterium]|uniref:signal peptidase I n=1 Tax=Halobacterium TaxID=2239 RepID=UPI0018D22135|nr:signal peptidase I [Halobacterium sp. CBA1132]MCG1003743.1 signal peptidase I [Halobacterium noricense]
MTSITLRRTVSAVATVLAVLVVALFVIQAAPWLVGADSSYVVLSSSMEPSLSPGDAVVVNDVDPATLEAGDVITFVRSEESTPVTHRVVEVVEREDGLAFRTQGDANDDPDPALVPASSVTGEVWFAIPYVGHVVLFANTPTGLAVLVGLPILAFVASELYAFARGDSTNDREANDVTVTRPVGELGKPRGMDRVGDLPSPPGSTHETVSGDAFTITTRDLKLSSAGFGVLAVYSGYVAYRDLEPVSVGVFAGAVLIVAFVTVVFAAGEESPERSDRPGGREIPDGGDVSDGGKDSDA